MLLSILHLLIAGFLAPQASSDLVLLKGRLLHQGSSTPIANASIFLARFNPNMPDTSDAIVLAQNVAVLMRSSLVTRPGYVDGFVIPNAERVGVSPDLVKPVLQMRVWT